MKQGQWIIYLEQWMKTRLGRKDIPALQEQHRLNEDLGIDSVMLLQLLVWMEVELGLPIPEEEVDPRIFDTVGSLLQFMESLQGCQNNKPC